MKVTLPDATALGSIRLVFTSRTYETDAGPLTVDPPDAGSRMVRDEAGNVVGCWIHRPPGRGRSTAVFVLDGKGGWASVYDNAAGPGQAAELIGKRLQRDRRSAERVERLRALPEVGTTTPAERRALRTLAEHHAEEYAELVDVERVLGALGGVDKSNVPFLEIPYEDLLAMHRRAAVAQARPMENALACLILAVGDVIGRSTSQLIADLA